MHKKMSYICDLCKKEFQTTQRKLEEFKNRHLRNCEENEFYCRICEIKFSQHQNLKRHMKSIHQGIRNHKCNKCEKSFFQSSSLKAHYMQKHDLNGKYVCKLCGKKFSRQAELGLNTNP